MNRFLKFAAMLGLVFAVALPLCAQGSAPVIFYLDILSGPNTGGESNNGVILTIKGNNFGTTQGTVTVGGGAVATYKTWTNQKIQVAIGPAAATGAVVVTAGGVASTCANHDDGCSFTVRGGNIYYVSPSGSDSAAGSFSAPWATLKHADSTIAAADTVYVMNGFATGAACDGIGWHANFTLNSSSGSSGKPVAYIAYPGATATIGSLSSGSCSGDSTSFSIRTTGSASYYVISGFVLRNAVACYEGNQGSNIRFINNDCESANAASQYASIQWTGSDHVYVYGNNFHDSGGDAKLNSGFYFTSNTNHGWFGWNTVGAGAATSSIMVEVHSTGGNDQFDWHLHDNTVENARCNGMVLASVDPSQGAVEVYNNVFYHNGTGPNPSDSSCWQYSSLDFSGTLDAGPAPSGSVDIYNNTFYDCGPFLTGGFATYGCVEILNQGAGTNLTYRFTNNIFNPTPAEGVYFSSDAVTSLVTGCSNNLYYQGGAAPSDCSTNSVAANPLFAALSSTGLNLQSGSPALGAGSSSHRSTYDIQGNFRPTPPAIGAYDVGGTTVTSTRPNPPTNLTVIVN
jgi:hypothetical protein